MSSIINEIYKQLNETKDGVRDSVDKKYYSIIDGYCLYVGSFDAKTEHNQRTKEIITDIDSGNESDIFFRLGMAVAYSTKYSEILEIDAWHKTKERKDKLETIIKDE